MRRPLPFRSIAAALAAVLALAPFRQVLAGGGCPHHDHLAASATPVAPTGHAGHGTHAASDGQANPGDSTTPTPCTCVGACQAGAVAVLNIFAPGLTVPEVFESLNLTTPGPARSGWILSFLTVRHGASHQLIGKHQPLT